VVDDKELRKLGQRLCEVDGVVGVLLGGSRARGEHTPESDFDLGLYYRPPLDIDALEDLARDVAGPGSSVTRPGEWGPWVDGGGWLHIGGTAVDWIYLRTLTLIPTARVVNGGGHTWPGGAPVNPSLGVTTSEYDATAKILAQTDP
jgi:hypothetical protein